MDPTKPRQQGATKIKGLSQIRRLPRLGKIRLGIKAVSERTGKEYPKDVDYFVCPDEVKSVYGDEPRELDIIIPIEDESQFAPQALKWWTASTLMCKGDGQKAVRLNLETKKRFEMDCPCEHLKTDDNPKGECMAKATLFFMIPRVAMGGCYCIDTGSFNNIVEINSAVDLIRAVCGRVALIPLKLRRVPREIIQPTDQKKVTKWLLQLVFQGDMNAALAYRDGAVLALQRSKTLALPEPDRDLRDDKTPIDVTDLEDTTQAEGAATSSPMGPPPSEGAAVAAAGERISAPHEEAPPARQPGEDEDDWLEGPLDEIKAALRAAKTMQELDAAWTEKVMNNKELDGKLKFELQEVLLEQKKRLKKSK